MYEEQKRIPEAIQSLRNCLQVSTNPDERTEAKEKLKTMLSEHKHIIPTTRFGNLTESPSPVGLETQQADSQLKITLRKWLLGLDSPEDVASPIGRWIVRPLKKGVSFFLLGILSIYIALCFWEGFAWSTRISPWFGLKIIRLIVVLILSVINVVILPFKIWPFLIFIIINAAILFIPIGIFHGVTLSPAGEIHASNSSNRMPTVLFLIGIGVLIFSYGIAVLEDDFVGLISAYILVSPML